MEVLGPFWPSEEDQVVMAQFFEQYPSLGRGMCYLFGAHRQAGMTRRQAACEVYRIVRARHHAGGQQP
jgi:hypothetical protein